MSKSISIETNKGIHNMSKDTFIRWLCLAEMIQITEQKAKQLNIDLEKYDWIKPIAIKKYMNERFKGMEIDFEAGEKDIRSKINNIHHTVKCHSQTCQKQISSTQNRHRRGRKKHAQLELS
jgi:hypothetical protein